MTIADLGAGTGYFSVRLARAVPRGEVIATLERAGLSAWVSPVALPDQYLVEARRRPSVLRSLHQRRSHP